MKNFCEHNTYRFIIARTQSFSSGEQTTSERVFFTLSEGTFQRRHRAAGGPVQR